MSLLLDVRPLRTRSFARLWFATAVSTFSAQVATVAVLGQVWSLTGSALAVGTVGLAQAATSVVFGLLGGSAADRYDRQVIVAGTSLGQAVAVSLLTIAAVAVDDQQVRTTLVVVLVAAQNSFASFGAPARRASIARLLPSDQLAAGVALTHLTFQASILLGPAVGGVLIATSGYAACYALYAGALGCATIATLGLPAMTPPAPRDREVVPDGRLADLFAGWRVVIHHPMLRAAFATDLICTVLAFPIALFPAINSERLDGSPETLGLMLSAIGAGGIAASLLSGAVTSSARPGRVMIFSATLWGVALVAFSASYSLPAILATIFLAGSADTVSVVARGALVQQVAPEAQRGRISAAEQVVGLGGPQLGSFRAGLVASGTSATTAALLGGITCVLGVTAFGLATPALRRRAATGIGVG